MPSTLSDTIRVGALSIRFVLDAEASDGRATAFECDVPADAAMSAPHSHDGFEETNYGLAGVTTFTVDGEQRELHPGEVVFIPRGAVHAFENRSDRRRKVPRRRDTRACSDRTTSKRSPRCSARDVLPGRVDRFRPLGLGGCVLHRSRSPRPRAACGSPAAQCGRWW